MPQNLCLCEYMTFQETLKFYAKLYRLDPAMVGEFSRLKIVRSLDLQDKLQQSLSTMSEGQKRRVSLCCALIHSPRLLLL